MKIDRDASGRPLSPKTKQQMWRLRKWNHRYQMRQKERNLNQAMNELQRFSEKLSVPLSVQETAAVFYRKALDADIVRGRSIAAVVAASLYVACRLTETPKTLKEIVAVSQRTRKEVARCYRLVLDNLKIEVPIHDPTEYVSRIAEEVNAPGNVQGLAFKIISEAKKKHVTVGKDPVGMAAAALYIAGKLSRKKISQKEISEAANITEVTVRNRKNELIATLNIKCNGKNSPRQAINRRLISEDLR
jgi:transcription initiation factor TFIIB